MYEFLVMVGGYEQRVKFFGASLTEARERAAEWVGDGGAVLEYLGWMGVNFKG